MNVLTMHKPFILSIYFSDGILPRCTSWVETERLKCYVTVIKKNNSVKKNYNQVGTEIKI